MTEHMVDRKVADGWERARLHIGAEAHFVLICPMQNHSWRAIEEYAAPASCFAEHAESDALEVGERFWVDCPKARVRGWAIIQPTKREAWRDKGFCYVRMEGSTSEWRILRAAIHREGPQSEPPEGGVFLGRYELLPERPGLIVDSWWVLGQFNAKIWMARASCVVHRIDDGTAAHLPAYRAALAVARALGLVEAEPERAEPTEDISPEAVSDNLALKAAAKRADKQMAEMDANIRLHAAAPDLLAACKAAKAYYEMLERATGVEHGVSAQLRAAIAKAEPEKERAPA